MCTDLDAIPGWVEIKGMFDAPVERSLAKGAVLRTCKELWLFHGMTTAQRQKRVACATLGLKIYLFTR